tara:strand:+ start:57 stop:272 length:216 start_codon:yes stop_codon:yes gene_type:complete
MILAMNFALWISSGFWGKDPTVFSPVSTTLNEMIALRNKLLMKGTSKDGGTRICRAVPEVIACNTYLPSFS